MIDKTKLPPCPVETTLKIIGDKWKVLILRDLFTGTKRFSELKKSLGTVTQKRLTQQLREREKDQIISRKVYPVVPPKVEYSLTDLGKTLKPVIQSLSDWGTYLKTVL